MSPIRIVLCLLAISLFLVPLGADAARDKAVLKDARVRMTKLTSDNFSGDIGFVPGAEISALLPRTAYEYATFALFTAIAEEDVVAEEEPWESVKLALVEDLKSGVDLSGIEKASGGLTVADVYERKAELAGSQVVVRGRTVWAARRRIAGPAPRPFSVNRATARITRLQSTPRSCC